MFGTLKLRCGAERIALFHDITGAVVYSGSGLKSCLMFFHRFCIVASLKVQILEFLLCFQAIYSLTQSNTDARFGDRIIGLCQIDSFYVMAIAGGSGLTSLWKSGMSGPFILELERFLIMQPNVFTIKDC